MRTIDWSGLAYDSVTFIDECPIRFWRMYIETPLLAHQEAKVARRE